MNIVFLDVDGLGYELNLDGLKKFGDVKAYNHLEESQGKNDIKDAHIILCDVRVLGEPQLKHAKNLKLICAAGSGYNHIDLDYCKKQGIGVTNVPGYAATSVAQHAFSMLFYLVSKSGFYDNFVKSGEYAEGNYHLIKNQTFFELEGKTFGIIGMGEIGRKVAQYAKSFGCRVVYCSLSGVNREEPCEKVSFETLLGISDVVSIHAPLTKESKNLIQKEALRKMKKTAYLLNLGRGGIINEADLAEALNEGVIAGAGLDVFETEPLPKEHALMNIKRPETLYMTPHIGFGSIEARGRLMSIICENIEDFLKGGVLNRVDFIK